MGARKNDLLPAIVKCAKKYYAEGKNIEAIEYFEIAINQGDPESIHYRGFMHQSGYGDKVNYLEAIRLYQQNLNYPMSILSRRLYFRVVQ